MSRIFPTLIFRLTRLFIGLSSVLVVLVLLLPVVLLPLTTSTPKTVCLLLAALDLILIIYLLRHPSLPHRLTWLYGGLLIVALIAVAASQILASTPAINSPNSIASLEQINLNGTKQWITLRGRDKTKPVLLYLGIGGPGAGGLPATFTSLKPLEDHFVVVNWDQPGTGKSYHARPINQDLTVDVFVQDALALTEYLKTRFNQDKIYVMGLSWGTILGTKLIQQHPEHFYAYVGNGQMVNTTENDRFGYDLALKLLEEKGDTAYLNRLKSHGPPPYRGSGMAVKFADYNNVLFDHMGSPNIPMIMALVPQFAPEYGLLDKLYFGLGLARSFPVVYSQLENLDFISQAPKLEVPVYFLVGQKDVNAVASIVERYYQVLEAPHKELIWAASGHGATAAEIKDVFVNKVLVSNPPRP